MSAAPAPDSGTHATGADAGGLPACDHDEGCITCGDRALPMVVVGVDEERGLALCAGEDDRRESVEVLLVAPVAPGDRLLVHAGTALAREAGA